MERGKIRNLKVCGQELKAIEMSFDTVSEGWSEYKLPNGITMRVKNVVTKIYLLVNREKFNLFMSDPEHPSLRIKKMKGHDRI